MANLLTPEGRISIPAVKADALRRLTEWLDEQASYGNVTFPEHLPQLMRRSLNEAFRVAEKQAARFGQSAEDLHILDLQDELTATNHTIGPRDEIDQRRAVLKERIRAAIDQRFAASLAARPVLSPADAEFRRAA